MEREFLGNTLRDWLAAGATFGGLWLAFFLVKRSVLGSLRALAKRTASKLDESAADVLDQLRAPEAALVAFYFAVRELALPASAHRWLRAALLVVITYRAVRVLQQLALLLTRRLVIGERQPDLARQDTVRNIGLLNGVALWTAALVFLLGNFGVNVAAIATGLGVTGVAVALGAQAILSDLFSAIVIYLDEPFTVGDSIMVDTLQGTVEHIGIKTTRVRALSGEMVVFPNSMLTSTRVRNFTHMRARRVVVEFGVSRQTTGPKLARVPDVVKGIIEKTPGTRFDRAHLKGIDETSLAYEAVFHVLDPDYGKFMDANQAVHLALVEALRGEGVELSYPTHLMIQAPVPPNA